MKQYILTVAACKRLIGKALASHPDIRTVLKNGTLVIIAGITNGYVAEEILASISQDQGFDRSRFFRGLTLPPSLPITDSGRLPDESEFPGDVVIVRGKWHKGKTIFDVVDDLKEGDVILKGANALDLSRNRAAILIGHPRGGTIGASLQAVIGRRVRLILPVGLEKRIQGNLDLLAGKINAPNAEGPRLWPVPGQVFTELDAINLLTGANAELIAAGGVFGAEGSIRIAVSGNGEQLSVTESVINNINAEPPFRL
ncbi:MAG: hypothetical protein JW944_03180 [Deltaproteobacteria bacterium]|nr:hypothetical protein [Deltaproteobacteria bacterium]